MTAPLTLYTCPARTIAGDAPLFKHPCGRAADALDEAGVAYEVKPVGGFKKVPLSRRGRRDGIRALSGQEDVPVLLVDDDTVVSGAEAIVAWARQRGPAGGGGAVAA